MQLLEVSCAVRRIYTSLGAKGLRVSGAIHHTPTVTHVVMTSVGTSFTLRFKDI